MHFIYLCVVCVCLIGLSNETALSDLPTNYDFFDAFPGCIPTTKDQGTCGDCYAFASSSMMSLRVCREANGLYLPDFSPQDMSSCNSLTDGCDGGIISYGFQYMELFGLTTEACTPYSDVAEATASACTWACTDGGETYVKVYCQSQSTSRIEDLERVKIELYDHGPLVVTFWCYDDLFDYEEADYHEGIYVSDGSGAPGGHAVLLVGWGIADTTASGEASPRNYWKILNSWGNDWGTNGVGKMGDNVADPLSDMIDEGGYYCKTETML